MAATSVTRLQWQALEALRATGLPGALALIGLLVAVVVHAAGVVPLRDEIARLDADSRALDSRIERQRRSTAPPVATPQQQLAAFARRFPGEHEMAGTLARLHGTARARGLRLEQAEFKFTSEPTESLARYTIVLPVKGDYRAVRQFIRDALRDAPALALEEVNLRRSDAKSPLLEAQLRLVLFVARPAPPIDLAGAPARIARAD